MKRIFSFVIFVSSLLIFSCGNVAGSGGTGPAPAPTPTPPDPNESKADWSGQTVNSGTFSDTNNNYMFEVASATQNLDITLPDGNYDVYMVEINNSNYIVPANQNQWIVAGGFLNSSRSAYDDTDGFVFASDLSDEINFSDIEIPEDDGLPMRVHYIDNFVPPPFYGDVPSLRSASPSYLPPINPNYVAPTVGTTKDIFVDIDPKHTGNISSFTQKKATLEAVGNHCYVWVVNDYLGSGFKQIDRTAAEKMKNSFDGFYEYVRYVFGKEADFIITGSNSTREMDDKKVNIVVYDILEDATEQQSGGVLGYFARKDYYARSYNETYSNEGKYFYVDSYFAKRWPGEIYSTLAHEFQHMISFNVKYLQQRVGGYAGYNEMLSMLCEDMLQTKMNVSELDSPKGRFLNFLKSYYKYGIFDNPDDAYFYAVTYMFGAFLARNYGGAKLVSAMAKNSYGNADSITEALKALGYQEKFQDVLREYAKALVLPNNKATFNKDAPTYDDFKYGTDEYKFPMTKFNIFNFKDKNGTTHSMRNALSNVINKSVRKDLHGKGIIPYYVGTAKHGGNLRLTFSSPANSNSNAYILVQKK